MARWKLRESVKTPGDSGQARKKTTNAERCKAYREKAKQSDSYRTSEQLRKKLFRSNRTEEQKAHDRELARLRMAKKRALDKQTETHAQAKKSVGSGEKLNKSTEKCMSYTKKRKLLHESGVILTPNKKRRIEFLECTMTTFKEYYQKLKESRKSKDTKQRRVLGCHVARMKKHKRKCCIEMGIRCATLIKWSKLDEPTMKIHIPTHEAVQNFYMKPYISYIHSGKKAVLKQLNKQRQTMTRTLRSAYEIYKSENPNIKLSYSKFTKLRPKHVQTQDRGKFFTCLCEKCVNIEMKLKAINSTGERQLGNKYEATGITLCDYPKGSLPNIKCAKRQCHQCGTKMLKERLHAELSSKAQVMWLQWANCKVEDKESKTLKTRKVLQKNEGEVRLLAEKLIDDMEDFSYHLFCATWQYQQYSEMKDNPQVGHVIAVLDFAENYTCHFQNECQSAHWCKTQVMIHPVVCIYRKVGNTPRTHEIVFISDDLKHDAHIVNTISSQTLQILKDDCVSVTKMVQFTDGCGSQYKSKVPFLDLSYSKEDFGVKFERHFFGSGHGKGPADGCSGVIKSAVTRAVKTGQAVVRGAEEFFSHCSQHLARDTEDFKRPFHFLQKKDIIRDRPDRTAAMTVKGTRQIHCVQPVKPKTIRTRGLSCACLCCQTGSGECLRITVVGPWETRGVGVSKEASSGVTSTSPAPMNPDLEPSRPSARTTPMVV
ncbi:uncharacterized protein LOC135463917 [Liolophura sinensis]|uniref:uncharacterized protein LOC135463917 n=1 Tax=Liolophura sinensis TaxID=3198878 RepID=UPI0031597719